MPSLKLFDRTNVQHHNIIVVKQLLQRDQVHWLKAIPFAEEGVDKPIELRQSFLAQISDCLPQTEHAVIGESIMRVWTVAAYVDQLSTPKSLEMLGGVGDG